MDLHCAAQKILRCLCLEASLAQSTRINHPPTSADNRFTPNRPRSLTESREGLDTFSDFACGIELSRDRVASRDRRRIRGLVIRDNVLQKKKKGREFRKMTSPPTTTSLSVRQTINGSHSFTIKGYSLAKGIGIGNTSRDTFTVSGYQWAIYFYPDGKNPEDNSAYVSVFIA
ncbi:unnamed protein product [Microthlaspi erraticum]|uniref:MATH domain-containing protein n=1 Tax=Microthlaspi erraticum TaxID=1685480 RepID=A0A6D2LEX7_9BRAS|nr:unnamed protein product [Microthlaspi erraticum]